MGSNHGTLAAPRRSQPYVENGVGYIPLKTRRGEVRAWAVVDSADFERLAQQRWYLNSGGYAVRQVPKEGGGQWTLGLHRAVMGLGHGDKSHVDHEDHDPLNCRRGNLRLATHRENHQNRRSHRGSSSRFRGVYRANKVSGRPWQAYGCLDGVFHHLGYFADEEKAGAASAAWRRKNMPYALD